MALAKQIQHAHEDQQSQHLQLTSLKKQFEILARERDICSRQIKLLENLYFPELRRRWRQISEAELHTNEWIYDPEKTTLLAWLESQKDGDGLFYITGKVCARAMLSPF